MTSTISDAGSAMAFDLGMGLVVGTSITELELQILTELWDRALEVGDGLISSSISMSVHETPENKTQKALTE